MCCLHFTKLWINFFFKKKTEITLLHPSVGIAGLVKKNRGQETLRKI